MPWVIHEIDSNAPASPKRKHKQRSEERADKRSEIGVGGKSHVGLSGSFVGQFRVETMQILNHPFNGEIRTNEFTAMLTKGSAGDRVASEQEQAFDESGLMTEAHEKAGFAVAANLAGTVAIKSDDRFSGGQCL